MAKITDSRTGGTGLTVNGTGPDADRMKAGFGRNIKDGRSMKTGDQVVDGGNLAERDDPMASNDSPVLAENITDTNLRPGKPEED